MITIASYEIGPSSPPFIIAEMSGNHNQSLERALAIVDAAANCGAHAIKLQTYTADTITIDHHRDEFVISDSASLWHGRSLHELYQQAYTPWEWHEAIFKRAKEKGLIAFSSPFDESAVDFLEGLNVPAYKIASFEMTHLPLVRKVAATGKPMIISTGMASFEEITETLEAARQAGAKEIVLLKCTSTYPASPSDSNINTIPDLREKLKVEVGLSDHTHGVGVAVASVALGASVIEKHFTLDRGEGGVDSRFSLEPAELTLLVTETQRAWESLGKVSYGPVGNETSSLQFRRSIYVVDDIEAGEIFTEENIRIIRPGLGAEPKYYSEFLGRKARKALSRGMPLTHELVD